MYNDVLWYAHLEHGVWFIWTARDVRWLSWSGVSSAVRVFLTAWAWGVGEVGRGSGRAVNNLATVGCGITTS